MWSSKLLQIPIKYPFLFGTITTGFKNGVVDGMVQVYVEDAEKIDWRRNMVFVTFGAGFSGYEILLS